MGFNADPDPAFFLNADQDPDPGSQSYADPDPDPSQTLKSQKVKFLHEKSRKWVKTYITKMQKPF
jgi:hypothetical protein